MWESPFVLLVPITLLMGGTLTLLVRHLVRHDPQADTWKIAVLYGVNTAGAALGCLLTDFALVPFVGLRTRRWWLRSLNVVAGLGALLIARVCGAGRIAEAPPSCPRAPPRIAATPLSIITLVVD